MATPQYLFQASKKTAPEEAVKLRYIFLAIS